MITPPLPAEFSALEDDDDLLLGFRGPVLQLDQLGLLPAQGAQVFAAVDRVGMWVAVDLRDLLAQQRVFEPELYREFDRGLPESTLKKYRHNAKRRLLFVLPDGSLDPLSNATLGNMRVALSPESATSTFRLLDTFDSEIAARGAILTQTTKALELIMPEAGYLSQEALSHFRSCHGGSVGFVPRRVERRHVHVLPG